MDIKHKAVIFDRDGILIDSESINLKSAILAFKELGLEFNDEDKKIVVGTSPLDYKDKFVQKYDFNFEKYRDLKREFYYKGFEHVKSFSKTVEIVKQLAVQKIPLGLVTSSYQQSTVDVIKKIGLENIFDVIVCFEDCDKRKPAPDCYNLAAEKLGLAPKECLVIEDTHAGLKAAKSAGMTCYVIPNETTQSQDFSLADKIINYQDLNKELLDI